jgi:hypothetical protein
MAAYIPPTSGQTYPDITGGQLTQTNGDPVFPGTVVTGPFIAGNVIGSDGSNTLAGLGATSGTANAGYVVMAQACVITQATNDGVAGQFACPIVIPAQSKIIRMTLMVTTSWTGGATTMGIGASQGTTAATAFTTATGVQGSTAGPVSAVPSTAAQIANWDNVSNATFQAAGAGDVQIVVLSGNTGSGVGTLVVEYIQGINLAS